MNIRLHIHHDGNCVGHKDYELYHGPSDAREIHLDITNYIQEILLEAARKPQSTDPHEKDLDNAGDFT